MKINKENFLGEKHGYHELYYDNAETLWYKCHYYNGLGMGYAGEFYSSGNLKWKFHWLNGKNIGCEQYHNDQYFYKTPNKKFGEEITWKE